MLVGRKHSKNLPFEPPYFFFVPKDFGHQSEYEMFWKLIDVFLLNQTGIKTDRDELFFDFEKQRLDERIRTFYSAEGLEEPFRTEFRVEDSSSYKLLARRRATAFDASRIVRCVYRPFDKRWLYYSPSLTSRPGYDVMRHMISVPNLSLVTLRINGAGDEFVAICSDTVVEKGSLPRGNYSLFPLYIVSDEPTSQKALGFNIGRRPGFSTSFLDELCNRLKLNKGSNNVPAGLTPEDIFHYAYGVFHSPGYRSRYAEFLKIDFPRLPLTGKLQLFRALALLGGELVALHLLESPKLDQAISEFVGDRNPEIGKISWSKKTVWVNKAQTTGFKGVCEDVWSFHIGGYQVCEKWLKDRKGRKLSEDDITHYQKIVVALAETIRLMKEIDEVIEAHGGWPGAFQPGVGQ
jgi:predicted helicase